MCSKVKSFFPFSSLLPIFDILRALELRKHYFVVEPQKEIPQCGSPGGPAGTGGSGTQNSEWGRDRVPQRKCIPAKLPQISYSSHYLQVLTKNFDLNLTQILEIKSIQHLKTSIYIIMSLFCVCV
jgi:hypothetical protein